MNELNDLLKIDDSKMTSDEKVELALKIQKVNDRLNHIQADKAESKAIKILVGLGFHQNEL